MKKLLAATLLCLGATPAFAANHPYNFTGTLEIIDAMCPVGNCPSRYNLNVNGTSYPILTDKFFGKGELNALNGATIQIKGNYGSWSPACPAGQECSRMMREAIEPASATIRVKGTLNELYFALGVIPTFPHIGNMELVWGTDNMQKITVDTGNQNFLKYNHKDVWVTGTLVPAAGGDMGTYFSASLVNGHRGAFMATPGTDVARGGSSLPTTVTEADPSKNPGGGQTR